MSCTGRPGTRHRYRSIHTPQQSCRIVAGHVQPRRGITCSATYLLSFGGSAWSVAGAPCRRGAQASQHNPLPSVAGRPCVAPLAGDNPPHIRAEDIPPHPPCHPSHMGPPMSANPVCTRGGNPKEKGLFAERRWRYVDLSMDTEETSSAVLGAGCH